jgi:hypothetical protein
MVKIFAFKVTSGLSVLLSIVQFNLIFNIQAHFLDKRE